MLSPAIPPDESKRLQALHDLHILDTPPEERFDRLIRLAVRLFDVPIALVTLVDSNRQWFKACYGLDIQETSREVSFCGHTILSNNVMVVTDTLSDERFKDNPLVTGDPHIRFYAGCPLQAPDGSTIGSFCLIDRQPRQFSDEDLLALQDLAALTEKEINAATLAQAVQTISESEERNHKLLAELRESEERYRAFFEKNQAIKLLVDVETSRIVEANPAALAFYGYSPAELIGMPTSQISRLTAEEQKESHAAAANETRGYFFSRHRLASGEIRDVEVYTSPITVGGQRMFYSIVQDITERIRAQRAANEQKDLTTKLFEQCAVAVVGVNIHHEVILWNRAAEELTGYKASEMLGTSNHWMAFYPQKRVTLNDIIVDNRYDLLPDFYKTYSTSSLSAKAIRAEMWYPNMNGQRRYVIFDASPVYDNAGQVIAAITTLQDFTASKLAEEEVRASRDFAQQITNNMGQGLCVTGPTGQFEYVNRALAQMLGYASAELLGKTALDVTFPEEHATIKANRGRRLSGETFTLELTLRRADGEPVEVLITSVPRRINGEVTGTISVITDLTERKKVERMKSEFISTVSHELRTPLTSIRGSLGLVMGGVAGELPPMAASMIEIAHKNSERLVRLINDILDIEKIESGKMVFHLKPLEILPLVEQALEANRGYAEQYKVSFRLENPLPGLKANLDSDRMAQVLANLLSNAAKFSPPDDEVIIRMAQDADCIRLSVTDHGSGIPEEFQGRIFQKFAQADSSTTRQQGGTGLGLSITKAIIERLGGQIGFETQAGAGTTFWLELPLWAEQPLDPPVNLSPRRSRILVCEDNADIATLLKMFLEDTGCKIDVAFSAAQARTLLAQYPGQYLAMTLDLMLPDQDGLSFIGELREHEETAQLPIIVVSARAEAGMQEFQGSVMTVVDWIDKPINHDRLMTAVRQAGQQTANSRPRLLHLEDDPDIVKIVAEILNPVAEVVPAFTVQQARQLLSQTTFDLIILDLELPDGNGMELINYLNEIGRSATPVVVFSAHEVGWEAAHKVAVALVKARTSNQELLATIRSLVGPARQELTAVSGENPRQSPA